MRRLVIFRNDCPVAASPRSSLLGVIEKRVISLSLGKKTKIIIKAAAVCEFDGVIS